MSPNEIAPSAQASATEATGGTDSLVTALDSVASLPLTEHAEAYQRVHAELQSALAEIDGN